MSKRKRNQPKKTGADWLWLPRLGFLIALGISLFLAWNSLKEGGVPGCGPESDCDKVLSSRWAYVFGVPVSVFAIPVYLGLITLLFLKPLRWNWILPLSATVLLAALWFVGIQAFALGAFCRFCMTAHFAGAAAAVFLIGRNPLPIKRTVVAVGVAVAACIALVVGQVVSEAPAPETVVTSGTNGPGQAVQGAETGSNTNVSSVFFTVMDGKVTLDLTKVPHKGPISAPKRMLKLFDYTCHHCRDLHHLLSEFRGRHSNELTVVTLPVPLDSACNPLVRRTPEAHLNACEYARIGLAVFFAAPKRFDEFSDWLFGPQKPPPLEVARQRAAELVGAAQLNAAMASRRPDQQLATNIQIYLTNYQLTRRGGMPQMVFEHGSSIGRVQNGAQLEQILGQNLGIGTDRTLGTIGTTNGAGAAGNR